MRDADPNATPQESLYQELRAKGYAPEMARELAAGEEAVGPRPDEQPPYEELTMDELRELAAHLGIVQQQEMTRPELIAALRQVS